MKKIHWTSLLRLITKVDGQKNEGFKLFNVNLKLSINFHWYNFFWQNLFEELVVTMIFSNRNTLELCQTKLDVNTKFANKPVFVQILKIKNLNIVLEFKKIYHNCKIDFWLYTAFEHR